MVHIPYCSSHTTGPASRSASCCGYGACKNACENGSMAETGRSIVAPMLVTPPRSRLLQCGYPLLWFVRILQASPGIVTSCLLLFKCRATLPTPGPSHMPPLDHADASLPDDPALLRIDGPIATVTLNRPAAFNS